MLNANDAHGIRHAIRRLTAVRKPGEFRFLGNRIVYEHDILRNNQYAFLTYYNYFDLAQIIERELHLRLLDVNEDVLTLRNKWCEANHPKRKLRLKTRNEMWHDPQHNHGMYKQNITYKAKTGEILEPEKYLRGIADMYAPSSTRLGYFIEYIKDVFQNFPPMGNLNAKFISTPDLKQLTDVFKDITRINSIDQPIVFRYFSDDAILGVQCSDGLLMCDSDISKSDGSQYAVFDFMLETMINGSPGRFHEDIRSAFAQLRYAIKIWNPEDHDEWIKLLFNSYRLFSGSTLTTTTNNYANLLIATEFARRFSNTMTKREAARCYEQAAFYIGYIVKIKPVEKIQELSFLKHFPAFNIYGDLEPVLMQGVILRALGKTKGDLPGKHKDGLEVRAKRFNAGYFKSIVHSGNTCIYRALSHLDRWDHIKLERDDHSVGYIARHPIPTEEIAIRYGLDSTCLNEFTALLSTSNVKEFIHHDASNAIFAMDYGI